MPDELDGQLWMEKEYFFMLSTEERDERKTRGTTTAIYAGKTAKEALEKCYTDMRARYPNHKIWVDDMKRV